MAGHIVLAGRAKDTIVLSSGENVEPGPIEDACAASSFISHMVLLGQDLRMLGALVVPNQEAFDELESIKGGLFLPDAHPASLLSVSKGVRSLRLYCAHGAAGPGPAHAGRASCA